MSADGGEQLRIVAANVTRPSLSLRRGEGSVGAVGAVREGLLELLGRKGRIRQRPDPLQRWTVSFLFWRGRHGRYARHFETRRMNWGTGT